MSKSKLISLYIFFLLGPIFSMAYALKEYRNLSIGYVIVLFSAYFGYCFEVDFINGTNDAIVYIDKFYNYYDSDVSFRTLVLDQWLSNHNHIEIVGDLIALSVSKFTRDYHFLYAIYGLAFGFVQSQNVVYIVNVVKNVHLNLAIYILGFLLTIPIWNINGFDFWFASQVYLFILLPVLFEGKYKRLFLLVLLPFIHFSFFYLGFITLILLFFSKFEKIVIPFFYFSLFSVFFDFTVLFNFLDYLPEMFNNRTNAYLNSVIVDKEGGRIIKFFFNIYHIILFFIVLFYYKRQNLVVSSKSNLKKLILFTFSFIAFFNLLSNVPSVGRFIYIGTSLMWVCLIFLLGFFQNRTVFFNKNLFILKVFIILSFCLQLFRYVFPSISIGKILSNVFTISVFNDDHTIIGNFLM